MNGGPFGQEKVGSQIARDIQSIPMDTPADVKRNKRGQEM